MSIYEVLSIEIPILAFSVIHQPRKTMTAKEYTKSITTVRAEIREESEKIQMTWLELYKEQNE